MKPWLMTYPEDKPSVEFYSRFAAQFDAKAVAVAANDPAPEDLSGFAGLFLTGGGDVDPACYGDETRHEKTYDVSAARDAMELGLIGKFIAAEKPIFGICRGLQILSVYFGGKLHQHVPDVIGEDSEPHRAPKSYGCFHPVLFDAATNLGAALRGVPETNSAHHQAVRSDFLPRTLRIAARSPAGIVEAVESFEFAAPVIAVQWHPERLPHGHPAGERLAGFISRATEREGERIGA